MAVYIARNRDTARKHGKKVLAARISHHDFQRRFDNSRDVVRWAEVSRETSEQISLGYMVVRKLNTSDEYVTWMPNDLFVRHYRPDDGFNSARATDTMVLSWLLRWSYNR